MKNFLIKANVLWLLLLSLSFVSMEAQDYWPDQIWVKLNSNVPVFQAAAPLNPTVLPSYPSNGGLTPISPNHGFNVSRGPLLWLMKYLQNSPILQSELVDARLSFPSADSDILNRIFRVTIADSTNMNIVINELNANPNIDYAERIPIDRTDFTPDDLGSNALCDQWGLYKIQAENAWNVETGDPTVVVAVVDDAVQRSHPDLINNCLAGWDIADNDNNPNPSTTCHSHGTHVAGIVGAGTNNSTGVASIGFNISILPVKATTSSNTSCNAITHGYSGIVWAADNGADVINMSWGGYGSSSTAAAVINYAWNKGVILVAAAGNNNNAIPFYPASYSNVISVASTNQSDQKSSFSSYGSTVDVSAPGEGILSTVPFNTYACYSGTSMASPMVAGLCGLVWSVDTSQSSADVINCILTTADNIDSVNPSYVGLLGSGRINAFQAVSCAASAACLPGEFISSNIYNPNYEKHEVSNWIVANNDIYAGASGLYDAGYQITLLPGFTAYYGSDFTALIEGCGGIYKDGESEEVIAEQAIFIDAYPNPMGDYARMIYRLEEAADVSLSVRDLSGRVVAQLLDRAWTEAGNYEIDFDASVLESGMYLYTLESNGLVQSKKLMIAR